MHVFSTSFNNKRKDCGWNDAKCLFRCNFTCQAQKNTIYRGFNLISYTIFCKTSAKIATIVGDVTGLQQRHHPIKYTSSCREDQTCFSMKAKSFLHIATFYQSTPSPLVPLWGYEFMWTEEQKSICRTLKRRWRHSCLASDCQSYVDQRLVVKEIIFKSQMVYYSNLISDSGSDHKAFFRSIDCLLHRKPEKCLPSCSSAEVLANQVVIFFEKR